MKWLAAFIQFVVFSVVYADDEGKSIYMEGRATDGKTIKAYINDLESGAPLACVNCHRESGLGTSESGKTIPPVSWYFLSNNQPTVNTSRFSHLQNKRKAYTKELLHRILTLGINSNGQATDRLMPRYVISPQQTEHLVEYLKTLYAENDPGVDSEVIRIATIVGPGLTHLQKQQHLQFMQGLFDMKNSLTRGELRRKRYSPIQKVPQYESYRRWELVSWELPDDPSLWTATLTKKYLEQPVFVVLSPLIKNNYEGVGTFCNEMKIPCLFAHGGGSVEGDYFNFSYRDNKKQQRDYLAKKIRKEKNKIFYLDEGGVLQNIDDSKMDLPNISKLSGKILKASFHRACTEQISLIVKADIVTATKLYGLSCPEQQQLKIKLLMDDSTTFQEIAHFLNRYFNPSICLVTDYGKMLNSNTRKIRTEVLTRKFGIENFDNENLAMDLYSYGLLTDSLHQLAGNFSRAYLMENIEHMLNSFPNYTYFNSVSGAPNQRSIVGSISEYCPQAGISS